MSAFVTDGSFHLASTVIRSIGKHQVDVFAGDSVNYRFGSRFCTGYFQYPFPESPSFIPSLYGLLEKTHSHVLIPMSNTTIVPVAKNKKMLDEVTTTPVADYSAIIKAMDKFETYRAAVSSGIPVPKTYRIGNLQDLHNRAAETGYPLILKPATSEGSSAGVLRVDSDTDLESCYLRINQIYGTVLLQEYIPGGSKQMRMVDVLFDSQSQPAAVFTAKKIREYPVTGGITTLGESTWEPDLAELGVKLMNDLKWKGVAEIEFKVDPRDNIPRMIEINPRFWSYLQLPICCGVDFPYLLYKVGCGDDIAPQEKYATGVRYIHPFRDLMSVISSVKKNKNLQDLLKVPSSYSGIKTTAYSFMDDPMLILEKPWISIKKKWVFAKNKRGKE
jgi:D-aspartate ligase